jgi:sortase A
LWNAARIDDYEESIQVEADPPLGVLTIDSVNIQVPIYNGTEEFNLNRGAGRIKGMARMDEDGNLAISSHRDGFFRGLKDIKVGDEILIQSTSGVEVYEVSSVTIVPKEDISPLEPTTEKILTLITCYPFYFVGNAPKRWIVVATPKYS